MFHARLFKQTETYRDHHFQPIRTSSSYPPPSSTDPSCDGPKQPAYLDGNPSHDRPLIVQFCANDPNDLLQAAQRVAPYCDAVDLNLGCPQGIARKGRYGSFLQESPNLIHSLVSKLAKELDIPVTAKMRILNTKEDTLRYARLLLDAGASWIAVHGRRREQKGHETGLADWSVIRYLRDQLPKDTVIFANGNVLGHNDLERCLQVTGADGVMSAEANLYDPGLFAGEEGRMLGEQTGEYWKARDGNGGWRMDAVMRRYLDILYRYILEKEPPKRNPLSSPGDADGHLPAPAMEPEPTSNITPPPSHIDTANNANNTSKHASPSSDQAPPSKKRRLNSRPTSSNLLAVQAHLFHLLRPLISKHTHIRDKLARARPGDMETYEEILSSVEDVTRRGLQEYETEPSQLDVHTKDGAEAGNEGEESSSAKAVARCRRPWWICQSYVRPLPKEALEKGSLQLSKKARRKAEEEEERQLLQQQHGVVQVEAGIKGVNGEERDGVPRGEIPKGAMVCG